MQTPVRAALLAAVFLSFAAAGRAQLVTEEVSIGFLPREWITGALQKTLSPRGRSVLVTPTGPLRLTDDGERVDAARRALAALQAAPALVPLELSFATQVQRTVQRLPVEPPVVERGIPIPNRYDPPRIIAGPGGVTVIPAQPRDFTTRRVGPGESVNLGPIGYVTRDPEVRLSETETTTAFARRFPASGIPGKPLTLPVLRQVADPAALRRIAVERGAVPEQEPAWTLAATELLVTPELSGGVLVVKVVPQIVLPPDRAGEPARRIPLTACAAGILVARGAPPSTGLLPQTDPEFYRTFFGAPQAADDTFTSLTVKADVQYLGNPPP